MPGAVVTLLAAAWLTVDAVYSQPPPDAPQLAQPGWYVTHEGSGFVPAEALSPPPVAAPLRQPTFLAPAGNAAEPTPIVVAAENDIAWSATQPAESSARPTTAKEQPAPTESSSRWSVFWRQIAGRWSAPAAPAAPVAANTSMNREEVPAREVAPANVSPPRAVNSDWSLAKYGEDLIHQAAGITTPQRAVPSAAIVQEPTAALPHDSVAVNDPGIAESIANPITSLPATIRPLPPTTESHSMSIAVTVTAPVQPLPPPAANSASPAATAAAPTAVDTPLALAVPPRGDPVLNMIADATAGATAQSGPFASLWRPLVGVQAGPPATPNALSAHVTLPAATSPNVKTTVATSPPDMPSRTVAQQSTVTPSPASGLLRQLTMSSTDDLRRPATPAAQSPILPEQQSWDGGWTRTLAALPNPFAATTVDPGRAQQAVAQQAAALGEINSASLVAFLQQGELIPEPQPAELNLPAGESGQPGQGAAAGNGQQADSLVEAERLGEEPEDTSLQFLRTATVLLEPGESQWDVGLEYVLAETDFPILLVNGMGNIVGVADAKFRVRELSVPIEYRMGLHRRVQGFISAPVGWANTHVSVNNEEAFRNDGGLGDVNFGLTMQLVDAEVDSPYWVATLAATAPTGGDPFTGLSGIAPSAPSLGQGFWSIQGSVLLIQPYDPLVVFYGLGMQRFFEHEYIGLDIRPGAEYSYSLGVGFAVNDRVTLSTRFRGAYVEETEVDGLRVIGSNAEPMTIRMAATISKPCNRIVEPFVEFGLTDDSLSGFFGVTWTFQPGANKGTGSHSGSTTQSNPQPTSGGAQR